MARSSVLGSAHEEQQGSSDSLPVRSAKHSPSEAPTNGAQGFDSARAAKRSLLSADELGRDAFLYHIAYRALLLTGANGGAIALRQDQMIVCRARYGESSPPLGAKLDANSGISGECMRTGLALKCDDTENDPRVERDVCRRLGIRSIAVVPVGKGTEAAGVLEVFSARPQAFEDAQLQILTELARLVADAVSGPRGSETAPSQPAVIPPTAPGLPAASPASPNLPAAAPTLPAAPPALPALEQNPLKVDVGGAAPIESSSPARSRRARSNLTLNLNQRQYRALAIAVFLIAGLVIMISLLSREGRRKPVSASPAQTVGLPEPSPPAQPSGENKPGTSHAVANPPLAGLTDAPKHASGPSGRELPRSLRQPQISRPETPIIVRDEVPRHQQPSSPVSADSPPAPTLEPGTAELAAGAEVVGKIVSSPIPSASALPVFQGISGGTLERSVNPVYPPQALALRLEGSVVLSVVIDESGNVRVLKTLSGDPILARAATDAVRQWHYHPYLLNGQPVKREAKITLAFKLP